GLFPVGLKPVASLTSKTMSARSSITPLPRECLPVLTVFPSTRIAGPPSRRAISSNDAKALLGFDESCSPTPSVELSSESITTTSYWANGNVLQATVLVRGGTVSRVITLRLGLVAPHA